MVFPTARAVWHLFKRKMRYSIQKRFLEKSENDKKLCFFSGVKFSKLWLSHCLFVKNFLPSFPQETLEERPACVDAMVELLEIAGKGFGPLACRETRSSRCRNLVKHRVI